MEIEKTLIPTLLFRMIYLEVIVMSYNKETGMYEGYIYCIIECCKGLTNRRRHKGYYWKYYNDIKSA